MNMKTKLLLPLILFAATAQAHLIDLTPGGVNTLPDFFWTSQKTFFDSAVRGIFNLPGEPPQFLNGWVSRFGALNGAEWFDTDLFTTDDQRFCSVSWDLANQQDGFWLTMILVEGSTADGTYWAHLYGRSADQLFTGDGIVTLNGEATISQIAFYGLNVVPDTGATLLLFGFALATLSVWKQQSRGLKGAG
jgi:hypothetical protein